MKKSHLIMASILASATILGANALAADGYITNADPNEVTLVASEDNTSARIILAEYDDDGRLKAAKTTDVTLNSGETIYSYLDLGFYKTVADGTKIMLWSDDLSNPATLSKEYDAVTIQKNTNCVTLNPKNLSLAKKNVIQEYNSQTSEYINYRLDSDYILYINNNQAEFDIADFFDFNMEAQLFTLTDSNEDGLYDRIDITAYITATIEDIRISDNEYYVYFIRSSCYDDMMIINENSSDANYEIYLDGEQITASDLQAGDVLSIICDELFNLEESSFYKIYVSRNTCTSKLTKIDTDEQTYTFANGETYELSFNNSVNLYLGNTYVLYFDVFGKIAYAEKSDSDNTYDMSNLNVDNNMAVYVTDTDDGEMSVITAYVNGAKTTLVADVDFDLNTGDAFFYTKDSDGYVNKIVPVLANSVYSTYAELYKTALNNKFNLVDADIAAGFAGDMNAEHTFDRSDTLEDCKLIFGAIVDYINYSSCGEVVFATNITDETNVDISICNEYDLADNAIIYKYDYNCGDIENRISTVSPSLFAYSIPKAAFTDDDYEVIDFTSNVLYNGNWSNDNYGKIRFALLKVIDNEITEAVIYVPSSEKG